MPIEIVPISGVVREQIAGDERYPDEAPSKPRVCIVTNEVIGPFKNGGIGTSMTGLAQTPRLGEELLERRVEQRERLHPEELKAPLAVPSSASGLGGTVARWRCIRAR